MYIPTATTSTSNSSTYTTIPISGNDVISRSFHNLSAFVSLGRPWSEFLPSGSLDRPDSLPNAVARVRKNSTYFRINYTLLILTCTLLSLIGAPLSLIALSVVLALWLILYFFREDPLILWGHSVNDRMVLIGLVAVSGLSIWFTGAIENIMIGVAIGIVISLIHALVRNPEGLFLDENEAVSSGLIGSGTNRKYTGPPVR